MPVSSHAASSRHTGGAGAPPLHASGGPAQGRDRIHRSGVGAAPPRGPDVVSRGPGVVCAARVAAPGVARHRHARVVTRGVLTTHGRRRGAAPTRSGVARAGAGSDSSVTCVGAAPPRGPAWCAAAAGVVSRGPAWCRAARAWCARPDRHARVVTRGVLTTHGRRRGAAPTPSGGSRAGAGSDSSVTCRGRAPARPGRAARRGVRGPGVLRVVLEGFQFGRGGRGRGAWVGASGARSTRCRR